MVRELDSTEVKAATNVLKHAFATDPCLLHLIPDENERSYIGPALARGWLRYGIGWGKVFCTENLEGVALRRPPGAEDIHPLGAVVSGMWQTPLLLGWAGTQRLINAGRAMDARHARAVQGPHWYCWLVAVDPAAQGGGFGGELMRHTFDLADEQGVPCYLETTSERALAVHLHHGYEIVEDGRIPDTDLFVWSLVRKPRTPRRVLSMAA